MDLSAVPTDDLMAALVARFDAAIFYGVKETGVASAPRVTTWRVKPNPMLALGLAVALQHEIINALGGKRGVPPEHR